MSAAKSRAIVSRPALLRSGVVEPTTAMRTNDAVASVEPASAPKASVSGIRWIDQSLPSEKWIPGAVSVGNTGAFAWSALNFNVSLLNQIQTEDEPGPLGPHPVFEENPPFSPPFLDVLLNVDAADDAPSAAATVLGGAAPAPAELRYYSGFATQPDLVVPVVSTTTAFLESWPEPSISDDGRFFSVGHDNANDEAEVLVFDRLSATPTVPVGTFQVKEPFFYQYREHRLSGDGSTVLLGTWSGGHLFDRASGALLFSEVAGVGGHQLGQARILDHDGDVYARGGNGVAAWMFDGAQWLQVLSFVDTDWLVPAYWAIDLSADGHTLAVAGHNFAVGDTVRLHVYDLQISGATPIWTWTHTASSASTGIQDAEAAVSISADGTRIALGTYGPEDGSHAELLVFERDLGPMPIAELDTVGSVLDADIASDGQFVLAGTKSTHAGIAANGGEVISLDLGGQRLARFGTASPGSTVRFEIDDAPGESAWIGFAAQAIAPVAIPGFLGALEIVPVAVASAGVTDAAGFAAIAFAWPSDATLVGATVHAQSVTLGAGAGRFQNRLAVPITP